MNTNSNNNATSSGLTPTDSTTPAATSQEVSSTNHNGGSRNTKASTVREYELTFQRTMHYRATATASATSRAEAVRIADRMLHGGKITEWEYIGIEERLASANVPEEQCRQSEDRVRKLLSVMGRRVSTLIRRSTGVSPDMEVKHAIGVLWQLECHLTDILDEVIGSREDVQNGDETGQRRRGSTHRLPHR